VRLGEVANAGAAFNGKPLDGVRVLALEQMQALPYATQLLARLGADVVKIETPNGGDLGRSSLPAVTDPEGRSVGATFLRNNLDKRSMCVDLKRPEGRDLVLRLAPRFDVVAENFKPGAMDRLGLGAADLAAVDERIVYVSVSGFGNAGDSPYRERPAFASITEAMSGIYTFTAGAGNQPLANPVGALGDMSAALFATIGILAALRHRDATGRGQHVDVAMLDSVVAMTDIVANFWSLGLRGGDIGPVVLTTFRAADGWFVLQVGREQHFRSLADIVGHPEWVDDPRFAERAGWVEHLDSTIRPAIEAWASERTREDACAALSAAGLAAGPCATDDELVVDPHVAARNMLVEMERPDGVEQPVLIPGNPVKLSAVAEGPEHRPPWLGEHTDDLLREELGLDEASIRRLHADGIVS
jgi:crotonobetainyl-CoA:carnitine CoA-transferase CaiB-like acyl-CoA transferase